MKLSPFQKSLRVLVAIAATVHGSCVAADQPDSDRERGGTPAAADLCNELGNVQYAAEWKAGKVTVTARGKHNTGGYEVSFKQSQIEIFPPQFSLVHKRPEGIVTQAITPFVATTSFAAADKPDAVTVHDARGQQRVPVQ